MERRTHSKCPACNHLASSSGWFTERANKNKNCELCNNTRKVSIDVAYRYIMAINSGETGKDMSPTARGFTFGMSVSNGRRGAVGGVD